MLSIKKAADLLHWFSRPKPRLIQSRLAVNSLRKYTLRRSHVKGKSLLGRQTHLLRLLHPDGMADEYLYYIIIGQSLSRFETARGREQFSVYSVYSVV